MFAIIDTETTGGNPAKDRVMEIAIILHDGKQVLDEFTTLVNPGVPIAPFIRVLTGIKEEMLTDAPTFEEIADRIEEMTDKAVFVAHNVGFDYGVVRNEFRRMGRRFERKQLCTVKLSRTIMPGMNSYSLGKLCKEIGINLEGRHRAYGDAAATAELFSLLMDRDNEGAIRSMTEIELTGIENAPHLPRETVEDLPEGTGLYYLIGNEGKVLYVSKSRNIRKQIIKDLKDDVFLERYEKMLNEVRDISYEITGSELVAQLLEIEEIQKHKPKFNSARRKRQYRYGIMYYTNGDGYIQLKVDSLAQRNGSGLLAEFTTRRSATGVLKRMAEKYSLHPTLCGMEEEAKPNKLSAEVYNQKFNGIFKKYYYKNNNFFIIGEGRSHHEQSVVWVEDNHFKGIGYFEPEYIENDIESIKEHVHYHKDSADAHRIIRNWLNKRHKDTVIPY